MIYDLNTTFLFNLLIVIFTSHLESGSPRQNILNSAGILLTCSLAGVGLGGCCTASERDLFDISIQEKQTLHEEHDVVNIIPGFIADHGTLRCGMHLVLPRPSSLCIPNPYRLEGGSRKILGPVQALLSNH